MLIKKTQKPTKKTVTFRVDSELLKEFKTLTKKHGYTQVLIIENAMQKAIQELREMEKK